MSQPRAVGSHCGQCPSDVRAFFSFLLFGGQPLVPRREACRNEGCKGFTTHYLQEILFFLLKSGDRVVQSELIVPARSSGPSARGGAVGGQTDSIGTAAGWSGVFWKDWASFSFGRRDTAGKPLSRGAAGISRSHSSLFPPSAASLALPYLPDRAYSL
jgi:hypothetical protein